MTGRRPNGAGAVRADGALIVRTIDPHSGKRVKRIVQRLSGESAAQHRRHAAKVLSELRSELTSTPVSMRQPGTVAEYFAAEYLRTVKASGAKRTTIDGYELIFRHYVAPVVGDIELADLRVHHIDQMDRRLAADGRSITTRRHARQNLGRLLRHAVRKEALAVNPMDRADPLPLNDAERHAVLEDDEVTALLAAAGEFESGRWQTMLALATLGMRRGEILGLRQRDFDRATGTVTISRNLVALSGGAVAYDSPKSGDSVRVLELPRKTAALLAEAILAAPASVEVDGQHADLVFCDEAGRFIHPNRFSAACRRLTTKVLGRARGPHQLRHWAASALIAAGHDVASVASHLGHSNAAVTLSVYAKSFKRAQSQTAATLADAVGSW